MKKIKNISIAGAGTMGASLAKIFSENSYDVMLYDISSISLENAKRFNNHGCDLKDSDNGITNKKDENVSPNIIYTNDIKELSNTDFMVEAISENIEIKHSFWKEVSDIVPHDAILTSNTSGLSITQIAHAVKEPERFGGMHWINPPHIIPLIEVISGEKTSDNTIEIIYNTALSLRKKPVHANDAPGFILNRIQFAIMRECLNIVERGIASREAVDDVMKYALGLRYACFGPFRVADMGGLDVFYNIASYLYRDLSNAGEPSYLLKEAYENKKFGIKNGEGFYNYLDGKGDEIVEYRDKIFSKLLKCLHGE